LLSYIHIKRFQKFPKKALDSFGRCFITTRRNRKGSLDLKKTLVFFLSLLLLLGLALTGCSSSKQTEATGKLSNKPITLNLYSVGGDDDYFNKFLIPMFEKKYAGKYKVQYARGGWEEVVNKIKAQGQHVNIDIVSSGLDGIPGGAKQGVWEQLYPKYKKQIRYDELSEPAKAYIKKFNGYGVPFHVALGGPGLEYNSKKMPNPPKNYDELIKWIKEHPNKFEYSTVPSSGPGRGFFFGLIQYLGEDINNPDGLNKTWNTLSNLGKDISVYPSKTSDTFTALHDGTVDLIPHIPGWFATQVSQDAVPEGFKLQPLEGVKQILDSHLYAIPKNLSDDRKQAALDFINFALSPEADAQIYSQFNVPANVHSTVDMLLPEAKQKYEKGLPALPDEYKDGGKFIIPKNNWVLFPDTDPLMKEYKSWEEKIQAKK
jgi:putative spermidine/putrescine transport system substrate-binding protein